MKQKRHLIEVPFLMSLVRERLSLCNRFYRYIRSIFSTFFENHNTVCESKQCVIFSDTNIFTRVVLSTTLTNDDVSGNYFLTTEDLNAKSFAFRFAAVLYFTFTFFMCHGISV